MFRIAYLFIKPISDYSSAMSHCIQEQNTSFLAVSRSIASDVATLPASLQHVHTNQQEILQIVTNIQQLQLTTLDHNTEPPRLDRALPPRRKIADRSGFANRRLHADTDSVGTNCTCTKTGSWLFRSFDMLSRIRSHQFGCPKYYEQEVTTLVNGKLAILNRFLGYSAYIGVQVIREDTSITIGPTVSVWPVVDRDSPAFRIIRRLSEYGALDGALAELHSLYNEGKASPRDTLPDGRTLMHVRSHSFRTGVS